jgi:hypothetical protein
MSYQGTVQNGVIVLASGTTLPEGMAVQVIAVPSVSTENSHERPMTLAELGAWVETQPCDLPEDYAMNHDHYLHGLPKKS